MTVTNERSRVEYAGNGSAVSFPIPFRFLDPSHIHVFRVVGTAETELVHGSDYTVSGSTVAMAVPPSPGTTISIRRSTPIEQRTDVRTQGAFSPEIHEDAWDRLTLIAQEMRDGTVDASTIITGDVAGAVNVGTEGVGVYERTENKLLRLRKISALDYRTVVLLGEATGTIQIGIGDLGPEEVGAAPADHTHEGGGYTHPDTHPAAMITEDATRQFVTGAQKATWDGHLGSTTGHPIVTAEANGMMSPEMLAKLGSGGSTYVHPATHPAAMIVESTDQQFVTSLERSAWNGLSARMSSAENRLYDLEHMPWHGAYHYGWGGDQWVCSGPKGLAAYAYPMRAGVVEVRFDGASPHPDDYTVTVTPHGGAGPLIVELVEKRPDGVILAFWPREGSQAVNVDFDIEIKPIRRV